MQLSFKSYRRRRVTTKNASVVPFIQLVTCVVAFSEPLHFFSWIWVSLVSFPLAWMTSLALLLLGLVCRRQIISFVCLGMFKFLLHLWRNFGVYRIIGWQFCSFNTLSVSPAASGLHGRLWEPAVSLNWFLLYLRCFSVAFKILSELFDWDASRWGSLELLGILWLCWLLLSWIVNCEINALSGLWMCVVCYPGWSVFRDKHCACRVSQKP